MDDPKSFGKNEQEIELLAQMLRIYSEDIHGSYNFKDSVLFTKSTFLVPLLTLKTLNSVITYLRYEIAQPLLMTLVPEMTFWKVRYRNNLKYRNTIILVQHK